MKKFTLAVATVMMSALVMATSLTDGLVGYWPFDGDAKDYSGNGNHGTTHGVTLTTDRHGKTSSAYHFNGSSYISIAANSELNAISDFTVATWIYADAWHTYWIPVACKGDQFKLELINENCPTVQGMWESGEYNDVFIGYSNKYKSIFDIGASGGLCTNHRIPLKEWLHVAVSRSGKTIRAYINGVLVDSGIASSTHEMNSEAMDIGIDVPGSVEYLYGCIDDMFLYSRALSSSEISAIYNGGLKVCKITFHANDGTERTDAVDALSGQTLSSSAKFTRDGSVFMGWALAPDGDVIYWDGEGIMVDSDKTLYAVWANPALTLMAESANWSSGSITLRCEDLDTSGAAHTYSLEYRDENNAWVAVGGAGAANVSASADGFAHLTDGNFCSRLDGIKRVLYRITDDKNGRVSKPCVTRNRHGIFVGVGEYGPDYPNVKALPNAPTQAREMRDLARGQEGFSDFHLLVNSEARYADVNNAFNVVSNNVENKPGDICIVYFSTHGGVYDDSTVGSLVLYDKPPKSEDPTEPEVKGYHESLLARHIHSLDPQRRGVAVICIISACHSGAFIDDSKEGMCRPLDSWCHKEDLGDNVAWITAANASSNSIGLFDTFMIELGWKHGWARQNSTQTGKAISFYDLGRYAIDMYNPIAQNLGLSGGEKRKDGVLRNIVAGIIDNEPDLSLVAPSFPINVQATKDKSDYVKVTWQQGSGGQPDGYLVLRNRKDSDEYVGFEPADGSETSKDIPDTASQKHPMKYAVAAYNGAGVNVSKGFAEGWRTIDVYRAIFYFNPSDYKLTPDKYVTPLIPSGESLTAEMRFITEKISGKTLAGLEFKGWKAKETDVQWVVQRHNDNWTYPDIVVTEDLEFHAVWATERTYGMTLEWLSEHRTYWSASNGDIAIAAAMMAANRRLTVGKCYALGIDPEDPNDDFRITGFKMNDGKPVITLSHTEDDSGDSFVPRINRTHGAKNANVYRVLGAKTLGASAQWDDITDVADPDAEGYRFFKATVELP